MMGWLRQIFAGKNKDQIEYARTVAYAQLNKGSDVVDHERLQNLGVKDLIVSDKGAMAMFDSETYDYKVNATDQLEAVGPNYAGQAMRLFLSPKLGLGNIDAKEARRELLLAEREMVNIEMNGEEYEYALGKGSRFTAQLIHFRQSILGSVEGKMMRNLLIQPNVTRVETGEISKKKDGSYI